MKSIITILFIVLSSNIFAQPKTVLNQTSYNFWLNEPNELTEKMPLIVFLHGKSLSGTDINRVKRYGALKGIEKGLNIPAYLVAPQLPSGSWNADKVDEIVSYMIKTYNIDEDKIYVTGMSLGSYGTMKYVGEYPNRVAAAISICGGGDVNDACNLAQVPIKVIHGDKDFIVPLSESKKIVNAIKKCNNQAPVEFEIIKGGNHGSVEDLYRHMELYDWLLQHTKEKNAKL
ncbi:prolyl oligopeptidase family serine peptidase [Flavobacterium dauae]|uniref:carboxylesterase family protein n=1 Tax=Flavobacterium dauae TaxID=1563479 RepID=UPI00101B3715|nr:prolyl oligopeptidase family serine peptidase [Flavobacterium dauae]WLD22519.1 prolyl oligopeptidase family serine peptidase [Flavobacterium dauae]